MLFSKLWGKATVTYVDVLSSDWLKVLLGTTTIKSTFTKRIVFHSPFSNCQYANLLHSLESVIFKYFYVFVLVFFFLLELHFLCEHICVYSVRMSHSSRLLCGFLMSCIGWTGIIIATSTNDWVVSCKYGMHTCRKMDELETKGLWTECVISTALYHCISLNQILDIPGEKELNVCSYLLQLLFCLHGLLFPSDLWI